MRVVLHVNDATCPLELPPGTSLLSALREDLRLTGTRYGCGHGVCGACFVLLDGKALPSCLLPAEAAQGRSIRTIEGVSQGETLHRVQQCFLEEDAMQCGYCTSGMIISAIGLLAKHPLPQEAQIREALANHLCRCGVYLRALRAIRRAAS